MEKWVHEQDYSVDRECDPFMACIYHCDGDLLFTIDKKFTDREIQEVINIANRAYRSGLRVGTSQAQENIRKAMGL